jgi:hypothetical protein
MTLPSREAHWIEWTEYTLTLSGNPVKDTDSTCTQWMMRREYFQKTCRDSEACETRMKISKAKFRSYACEILLQHKHGQVPIICMRNTFTTQARPSSDHMHAKYFYNTSTAKFRSYACEILLQHKHGQVPIICMRNTFTTQARPSSDHMHAKHGCVERLRARTRSAMRDGLVLCAVTPALLRNNQRKLSSFPTKRKH